FPHERYALQNTAARMGLLTSHWQIWQGMVATFSQIIADYLADKIGQALDVILTDIAKPIDYDLKIGGGNWKVLEIKGTLQIQISDGDRTQIENVFKDAVREYVRLF